MANFTKIDFTKKHGLFTRFNWMDTAFLLTVGTMLAWSLTIAIIGGTYLEFAPFATFVRIFFIMAALRIIFYNKVTLIFAGTVLAVALLILIAEAALFSPAPAQTPNLEGYPETSFEHLLTSADAGRQNSMLAEIGNFISGTIGFVTGFEFYSPSYDSAIQWVIAIGLASFVFTFGFFWFNFFAILSTMLVFGLVLNTGYFFYNLSFYVFIFSVVAYLIRHLNLRSMGTSLSPEHKNSPFALYALPFTAVCLIVAIALPTPQSGSAAQFADTFIRRPFNSINESMQAAFAPRYFSLAQTGFGSGNTRRLGGNVAPNHDTFMRIRHPGPIYLTGNIFDRYTGFSWINSFDDEYYILDFSELDANIEVFEQLTSQFTAHVADDFIETFIDASLHGSERLMEWNIGHAFFGNVWLETTPRPQTTHDILSEATSARLEEGTLLVEHDMRKFTVFTTGLVSNAKPPEHINFLRNINGSVQSDLLMERNTSYEINYAELPDDVDKTALLAASRHGLYRDVYSRLADAFRPEFGAIQFSYNNIDIPYIELLRVHLIPRANNINEIYTILPDHFPERVSELTHHLIAQTGATTNLEKAIVLEDFLRSGGGFEYSLTPGNTPIDRDFVDHFLFDLQTGYCVHFASAFVTMARAAGLPARYVEGFIVTGDADADGYLSVINRQGHAWAEVYFEGYGWHRFDPTPPAAIFTWPHASNPTPFRDSWTDYEFMDMEFQPWLSSFPPETNNMEIDSDLLAAMTAMDDGVQLNISIGQVMIWSLMITIALVIALLGGRAVYFEVKKMSVAKKGNNEAAIAYFHQMLRYMRLFLYEIEPYETAMAFGARVGHRVRFEDNRTQMTDLSRIFSRARYGHEEISDEDREKMAFAVKSLDKRLWGYMGPRKYIMYKYIMCIV